MKRNGNVAVNRIYNPRNIKPSIPVDIDEVDSAMERFVRKKYELKTLEDGKPKPPSRQDPSYTSKPAVELPLPSPSSPPFAPAALPAKPKSRFAFGLRSLSSSHHSSTPSSSRAAAATLPSLRRRESLETSHVHSVPLPNNKQSRTLGVSIADRNGSLESKLEKLRDMGFMDERRNMTVLKGLNGDVERCIDTLTRLGEKSTSGPRSPTSPTGTQSGYRTSSGSTDMFTPPSTSSNPFDKPSTSVAAPPLPLPPSNGNVGISINRSATGGNTPVEQKQVSHNPFDALDQSFQNLQVSSQPLFPNMTGGYPSQQANLQLSRAQTMTPPVPSIPHQHQFLQLQQQQQQQQQNYGSAVQPPMNGHYNPFMSHSTPATPYAGTPNQPLSPTNPFFTQPQQQQNGPQQVNNSPYTIQHHNTMPALSPPPSSYMYQQPQQPQQQQPVYPLQQQPAMSAYQQFKQQQPQQPQQPNRIDKSSILALYNFSQPPPTIPEQPQQQQQAQQQSQLPHLQTNNPISTNPYQTVASASPMIQSAPATTTGAYANHNPFFTPTNAASSQPASFIPTAPTQSQSPAAPASNDMGFTRSHVSQESIDIRQAHSGRHSPDIFASLSARY